MSFTFKLEKFKSPRALEALLSLIKKNQVDIYDIPIALITDQYLDYIKSTEFEDPDVISEFLVMAATLLDIKAKMLLPAQVNEEGEEEDPRAELVEMLIQYKIYKFMSLELKDRQIDAVRNVYKRATLPKEVLEYVEPIDYERLVGDIGLAKLNHIFKSVVGKQKDKIDPIRSKFGNIEKDEINLEEKQLSVEMYVKTHKVFSFRALLKEQASKMEIIVTFLIVLEMIKVGKIKVVQDNLFVDIMITAVDDYRRICEK